MKKFLLLVACLSLTLFTACSPKVPSDVPKLYPCQVKVLQGTAPLEGANVTFYSEGGTNLTFSGKTDASGIAAIKTIRGTYIGNGAPAGKYKVTVVKPQTVKHWKTPEELAKFTREEQIKYDNEMAEKIKALGTIVAKELSSSETTPLSVEVTSAGGEVLSVDLDKYKK